MTFDTVARFNGMQSATASCGLLMIVYFHLLSSMGSDSTSQYIVVMLQRTGGWAVTVSNLHQKWPLLFVSPLSLHQTPNVVARVSNMAGNLSRARKHFVMETPNCQSATDGPHIVRPGY
jgi:hypothetical protein